MVVKVSFNQESAFFLNLNFSVSQNMAHVPLIANKMILGSAWTETLKLISILLVMYIRK